MKKIIIFLALIMTTESMAQNSSASASAPKNQPQKNTPTIAKPTTVTNNANANSQANPRTTLPTSANISNQVPSSVGAPSNQNMSEELQKRINESKEFDQVIRNLSPDKKQKFDKINNDFIDKMGKLYAKLETNVSAVSNIKNIMIINDHLFPSKDSRNRAMPKELKQKYDTQITQFSKLTKEKKKATKQEIIKFRKEIMALQKERRKQIKDLFGKDFSMMKESESEEQIKKDEDLINAEK